MGVTMKPFVKWSSITVGSFSLASDPNRVRRRVGRKLNETTFAVETFVRPSRGYAKHNRRIKVTKRNHHV